MSVALLEATVISFVITFVGAYFIYSGVCLLSLRKKKRVIGDYKELPSRDVPTVSIIIPVYNESQMVSRKMENLRKLIYPRGKLEVVFVDGGSTDGTAELIEKSEKDDLTVRIVRQGERRGFNIAVIEGFAHTSGEVVCITGGETAYDPAALNVMIWHLRDPKIGAVTGRQIILNAEDGFMPRLESAYRNLYDFVREAESHIDSPFDMKGEIAAVRRSIFAHLVERPGLRHHGCIDCCLPFQGKIDGYRTVYEPAAVFYELSPSNLQDSLKQMIRRAATLIETLLEFRFMMLKRKFGALGMLIMPMHFLMLCVLPFLLLVGAVGTLVVVAVDPTNVVFLVLASVALLASLLSRSLQAFLQTQLALIVANIGLLRGVETQRFERVLSTRSYKM